MAPSGYESISLSTRLSSELQFRLSNRRLNGSGRARSLRRNASSPGPPCQRGIGLGGSANRYQYPLHAISLQQPLRRDLLNWDWDWDRLSTGRLGGSGADGHYDNPSLYDNFRSIM